ncbi:MAG: hypothetical protein Q8R08_02355 [bacterium]|nr:hypothetical protein [bacterium]
MNFFGNKLIRDTGFMVWGIGGLVIKNPVSISAFHEIREEQKKILLAREDAHFAKFETKNNFFYCVSIMPYLSSIPESSKSDQLRQYFAQAFAGNENWPETAFDKLSGMEKFTEFIELHFNPLLDKWKKHLMDIRLPMSSSHGDFFMDNILLEQGQLKFIDWWQFEKISCRYFDLINFQVFESKKPGESWMAVWLRNSKNPPQRIFEIKIPDQTYLAYSVWKIARELKMLSLKGPLSQQKLQKYSKFIDYLNSMIINAN